MYPALRLVSENAPPGVPGGDEQGTRAMRPGNGSHRKPTLLVVEDEILVRMSIADYLRNKGYRVLEASNAGEALAVFAAGEPIELVFSDINMPGRMNGSALAQWIRQFFPDVKILLTSSDTSLANDPSTPGDDASFIKKPYVHEALLVQIRRMLLL